eukprot:10110.XXX_80957_81238_1 [CDS] Oithona nana genome sequencing.
MNENMNVNMIMPGGRGWKEETCWLGYVCILFRFAAGGDKETQLEKLARKVLLIFAGFSVNDLGPGGHPEILSASDIIKMMTNEKCTAFCSLSS